MEMIFRNSFPHNLMTEGRNLDLMSSSEREKKRAKQKRSPEKYRESREKVQEQYEALSEDKEQREQASEVLMFIEMNEEKLKDELAAFEAESVLKDTQSYHDQQWARIAQAFHEKDFDVVVDRSEKGHPKIDLQFDLAEGNISEKIPLKQTLQESLQGQALRGEHKDLLLEDTACPKCDTGILMKHEKDDHLVLRCSECQFIVDPAKTSN